MSGVPPFPVVCGAPRSGTTLLRFMLDAHPDLAIPPETGFLTELAQLGARGAATRESVLAAITGSVCWPDFHVDPGELRREVLALDRFDVAEGARAFYRVYARRFGKPRGGDKTPGYSIAQDEVASVLPEAHFVHIFRDGRDVAVSVRGLWFSPGSDPATLAADWCRRVRLAREQGARARRYLEVRYESLVTDTRRELERICAFLELRYDPAMERYHERAPARLQEHETRTRPDGSVVITKAQRIHNQRFTQRPPEPARIGRFRADMTAEERARFEQTAGPLLRELGYEV